MDWLFLPIDSTRAHDVSTAVSWHARMMTLAWGVIAPLAVLIARFFKILPKQNWPDELDSLVWWRSHWIGHSCVLALSAAGLALVVSVDPFGGGLHERLGYLLLLILAVQVLLGIFRGSKGGPTAPNRDGSWRGHHYDMTSWRRTFETVHKTLGYVALALAISVLFLGLWKANAPIWMWLTFGIWWFGLVSAFVHMQRRGMAVDTYQAIWGDDPSHPGNQRPSRNWGAHRPKDRKGDESCLE